MIRIVLADDHPVVTNGLEGIFRLEPDIELLRTCVDGEEALAAVLELRPDVLIADLRMPKMSGLDVVRALRARGDETRVVILTGEVSDEEMLEGFRLGIKGVLLKELAPRLIIACVRRVASGGQWLETQGSGRAIETLLRREALSRQVTTKLTPREIELVRLASRGMRNKELAERLEIGEGTVKAHLHNVYRKLEIQNRVDLVLYARENGIT